MPNALALAVACLLLLVNVSELPEEPVLKNPQLHHRPGPPDTCLKGPFHRAVPAPEEEVFDECLSWQNKSCCNTEVPRIIDNHKAVGLYNYSWDLCGNLSQACEEFIKDEECFYQCEPMLGHFESLLRSGYISGVPVCASYCDSWFEACMDDLTCVEDWLADFDFAANGNNSCPTNSTCMTFKERYGNAQGLCNKMWGSTCHYSTDTSNCTVMKFDSTGSNPNFILSFLAPPASTQATTAGAGKDFYSLLLVPVLVAVALVTLM